MSDELVEAEQVVYDPQNAEYGSQLNNHTGESDVSPSQQAGYYRVINPGEWLIHYMIAIAVILALLIILCGPGNICFAVYW